MKRHGSMKAYIVMERQAGSLEAMFRQRARANKKVTNRRLPAMPIFSDIEVMSVALMITSGLLWMHQRNYAHWDISTSAGGRKLCQWAEASRQVASTALLEWRHPTSLGASSMKELHGMIQRIAASRFPRFWRDNKGRGKKIPNSNFVLFQLIQNTTIP